MLYAILIILAIIIYIASLTAMAFMYEEKDINLSFWSFICIVLPIVNTVAFCLLNNNWAKVKEFFSLKKFIDDINR